MSVPPVDPVDDNISATPTPTRVPPINTFVNKSFTRGLDGIGIISRRIV